MVQTINRPVVKLQRQDITFINLHNFYADKENHLKIVLVYEGSELRTLLSYEEWMRIQDETQLRFYLYHSNNNHIWRNVSFGQLKKISERFPLFRYFIVRINESDGDFISRILGHEEISKSFELLQNKGAQVFRVKIPRLDHITNDKCCGMEMKHTMYEYYDMIVDGDLEEPWYLQKMTDTIPTQGVKIGNVWGKTLGEASRTIYIVGPCIAGGIIVPEGESLAEILLEKLQLKKMEYAIRPIQQVLDDEKEFARILTFDIKKNDIVIFISHLLNDCELDTTDLYNAYNGEKWLYQDVPMHATVTGNRLIVDAMIETIIEPACAASDISQDNAIIYQGEPQFNHDDLDGIENYVTKIRNMRHVPQSAEVGALVMNCNPFTYGHRHLVEYAAGQVDFLYLFIVEEDLSAVPFSDRLFMAYEGTKDFSNVVVVPSGQFIASQTTFKNYFERETEMREANAEEDLYLFARYIAKGLNITKRFVGQEPLDYLTNTYNQTMKEIFPKYGLELVEIPRKELDDGEVISASTVRELLLGEKWDNIEKYVPATTLEYLKKIEDVVRDRIKRKKEPQDDMQERIQEFVELIGAFDKVILYSIGKAARGLIALLPQEVAERFEYCDKCAIEQDICFQGKKVIPPGELLSTYRDYKIIVASTLYGSQIYEEFVEMGVDMDRCIFNMMLPNVE